MGLGGYNKRFLLVAAMHQVALMIPGCFALLNCLVKYNLEGQFHSNTLIWERGWEKCY